MANKHFEYLVLSHMWGDPEKPHLKLEVDNLAAFQESISWYELSSVYREAIRVTLEMGYKYLWIDSLCIIQNSTTDWKYEARLMATVYGNAVCNLAFLFPSMSETPLRDDPRVWNPCLLREATPTELGVYIQHPTSLPRHPTNDKVWLVQRDWPLFSRAWTFQEYLLAPRTLLLGHKNLMFQCSHHFYDELLGPVTEAATISRDGTPYRGRAMGKWRYFPESLTQDWDQEILMSSLTTLKFATDWQACVTEYRSRALTKASDRVVAFAGIARAYTNMGALTYLAGCWAEYFPVTVLWYVGGMVASASAAGIVVQKGEVVEEEGVEKGVCEKAVQNAPTWSQFSIPIYTRYRTKFMFDEDEMNSRLRFETSGDPPPVLWHDIHWSYLDSFQFPDQPMDEFPDAGFADFEGLQVSLVVPMLSVRVSWIKELEKTFDTIRSDGVLDADVSWKPEFIYFPDDPLAGSSPPKNSVLALVSEFQLCRVPGINNVERRLAGLVLVRGERRGTWRRVGAWKLKVKITGMEIHDGNVRHVAERWSGYKLWDVEEGEKWWMDRVTLI
ncbi:HET-domain-containing protein [Ophiobolus disseminans]|uniref:HET-domain-containing protein n=1 Tax=Ophiobolus disseminans TaxID=1469910 RepID=A0A6A6ZX10_9PLEO|nr:HET-domain-containing protein [Ophiobolus disseminans]